MSKPTLEERLRWVIETNSLHMSEAPKKYTNLIVNVDNLIPEIIACFKEEGWKPEGVEVVTRWERGKKPHIFMIEGKEVMTGKEWLDRFTQIYLADHTGPDYKPDKLEWTHVLEAAKRASGVEDV